MGNEVSNSVKSEEDGTDDGEIYVLGVAEG